MICYFLVGNMLNARRFRALGWASGLWMSVLILSLMWSITHHVSELGLSWLGYTMPPFLGPAGLVLAAFLMIVGTRKALEAPHLVEIDIQLKELPKELNGLRIVQLSDIHIGPTLGRAFMESIVARTNALEADLIVITGDLVDGSTMHLASEVEAVFRLKAPLGVFFITGNHEFISGVDSWVTHLREGGIEVLENATIPIEHQGESFNLVGIEDWDSARFHRTRRPNLPKALKGVDTSLPTILLAHQPKAILEASELGIDLQLSGHTHGGQFAPFNWLIFLDQPYRNGLYQRGDTQLYINEGTGYWGPPLRIGTRSEITHITLLSEQARG